VKRAPDRLSTRALNRALLERQRLLRRSTHGALETIEHLVGLQAQVPNSPYLALWTRLAGFRLDDLTALIMARRVVRLALMRSTIHMVSARDCLTLRPLMQPVLERALTGTFGRRLVGIDRDLLATAGRALVEERPQTLGAIGAALERTWPGRDPFTLAHGVRALVPLVQVPPRGLWGEGGAAVQTSAEKWLGRRLAARPSIRTMIGRYLGAFGPASVRDVQMWSGLTNLREHVDRLRPALRTFSDEHGVELFDLPDAPRPRPEREAPPRFLPEFDNLLLGHKDRARVVPEAHRGRVLGRGGLMTGSILIDGFVGGRWHLARQRHHAMLSIESFAAVDRAVRSGLESEGQRLLRFVAPDADGHDVRFLRGR
jgi:hypothetical protein